MKARSLAWLGIDPNSPSVPLDDFFAYRETYAGAGIFFSAVEPLEHDEDTLGVLRIETDAVVGERKDPCRAGIFFSAVEPLEHDEDTLGVLRIETDAVVGERK